MVLFHCSNLPKSFFQDTKMTIHPIISDQKGGDVSFGTIQERIKTKPFTLLRILLEILLEIYSSFYKSPYLKLYLF